MLDVARHFFTKDEVKQMLDVMALHKINTLFYKEHPEFDRYK